MQLIHAVACVEKSTALKSKSIISGGRRKRARFGSHGLGFLLWGSENKLIPSMLYFCCLAVASELVV